MGLFNFLEKKIDLADVKSVSTITGDVADKLAFKKLAFYIGVSYIADTISKCEFKTYVGKKEVKEELYYLLNVQPNINQNASDFKTKLIFKLFKDNEALIFQNKNQFYVADSFGREKHPFGKDIFTNVTVENETLRKNLKADEVFYFKLDEEKVKELIDSMHADYEEILKYAFETYKVSNGEKYKLAMSDVKAGDTDFNKMFEDTIKKQLQDFVNNPKAIYPQFKGYDLQQLSKTDNKTDSTDIRNLRKDIFETVAEALKMPVSMFYGNMTNVKDIISSYITFRIDPLATMLSEEFTRKTSDFNSWKNGNYVRVDTTNIIHIDIFEIADKIEKILQNGVYCIDEVREKIGDSKLNTDFSKQHWMTKNSSKIEDVVAGIDNDPTKGGE